MSDLYTFNTRNFLLKNGLYIVILLVFIVKILGANMVRFYLKWDAARNKNEGSEANG